jgi:hypothetical protein
MSDHRVLYYPNFEPKRTWLLSTLLFVDGVNRIIPNDAEHKDSDKLSKLRDALSPDPAEPISTTQKDFDLYRADRDRMQTAFASIIEDCTTRIAKGESVQPKYELIYRAKIPFEAETLLKKKRKNAFPLMKEIKGNYKQVKVESRAADLILSYVANRIATREGIDAITDYEMGFSVNTAENQKIPFDQPAGFAAGCLIGAIASCQVPGEIRFLTIKQYNDLRNQYSGIRTTFKKLSIELAQMNNLNTINDHSVFRKRLEKTVREFVEATDEYASSQTAKKVKKWLPWGVGALLGLGTAYLDPSLAVAGKLGQVGIQVFDRAINKPTKDVSEERPHQILCRLKKDVLKRSLVKTMLHL